MAKTKRNDVDRRNFLKSAAGAAAGAAALAVTPATVAGAAAVGVEQNSIPAAQSATAAIMPMAAEVAAPPSMDVLTEDRSGSDFMVDVIKSLGFEYICRQSRIELPRPARIVHQLRRQQDSRVHHLLP